MEKIISLFQRNYESDHLVRNEVVPGAEWVKAGEGVATQKFDGTCCMVRNGKLYKRYELKKGRMAPVDFEAAQTADNVTGDIPGWVPIGEWREDRWHHEAMELALADHTLSGIADGTTYELCGPKIQGNPEKLSRHTLIKHGSVILRNCPRDFVGIQAYLATHEIEGIVWHHPDGRMVKIKARDFGRRRTSAVKE